VTDYDQADTGAANRLIDDGLEILSGLNRVHVSEHLALAQKLLQGRATVSAVSSRR
jgi:hypothetical protein